MRELLAPFGVSVVGAAEKSLAEPEETEDNFIGNARIKAHAAVKATGLPALSDDSGIEVEALNNEPGVYTADWAETPNGRDFVMAMTKTHDKLEAVTRPTRVGRVSAQRWCSRGQTAMMRCLRERLTALSYGLCVVRLVTAMTPCSCLTDMTSRSGRWHLRRRMKSAIAPTHSQNW